MACRHLKNKDISKQLSASVGRFANHLDRKYRENSASQSSGHMECSGSRSDSLSDETCVSGRTQGAGGSEGERGDQHGE